MKDVRVFAVLVVLLFSVVPVAAQEGPATTLGVVERFEFVLQTRTVFVDETLAERTLLIKVFNHAEMGSGGLPTDVYVVSPSGVRIPVVFVPTGERAGWGPLLSRGPDAGGSSQVSRVWAR